MRGPAFTALGVFIGALCHGQIAFTQKHFRQGGDFLWGIAAGSNGLVAVGERGAIWKSSDGETWSRQISGTTEWLVGVGAGSGRYIAVGDKGVVLSSSDGTAWERVNSTPTTERLNNVVFGGGKWVAVGERGTIIVSSDGLSWSARTSTASGWLRGLTYVPDRFHAPLPTNGFFAAGESGVLLNSADGELWSAALTFNSPPIVKDIEALVLRGNRFFAGIGQDGLSLWNSGSAFPEKFDRPDGTRGYVVNYIVLPGNIGIPTRFRGLAQGADAIFALGEGGTIALASAIAAPWARIESGTTANLVSGVYSGNTLYVVGENETVIKSTSFHPTRLINVSTRGNVGQGGSTLISGFVVQGAEKKRMLIRAAGPALGAFGVSNVLSRPVLTLLDNSGRVIAENAGWGTSVDPSLISKTTADVGAFPFAAGSADAAILTTLEPGAYTVQVSGASNTMGIALVEAYDADISQNPSSRAINISTRGFVGGGESVLIAGFNLSGVASRRLLIRAIGPSLEQFGIAGALSQPRIELIRAPNSSGISADSAWSGLANADEVRGMALLAGAFALTDGSKDEVLLVDLSPGSWTVRVSGRNGTSGIALVEVYDLP